MDKKYILLETTESICSQCLQICSAKLIKENGSVYLLKNCKEHGMEKVLYEQDFDFYDNQRFYCRPGTLSKIQTKTVKGCPYDCGLCPDHEQHTCIGLIEVTNKCNLRCPVCYANSGEGEFLSLEKIEEMLKFFQDAENGKAEILQISGGEPTMHPQIIEIIRLAKELKFKYVMLNTNGIRIANDEAFVESLTEFKMGFEIYLQFDGLEQEVFKKLRNAELLDTKKKAVANLEKYSIPTTLVTTLVKDVNMNQIGRLLKFGMDSMCIRGINFQPMARFGRVPKEVLLDPEKVITVSTVISEIEKQSAGSIVKKDFVPLPCHPERVAFTYLYKDNSGSFVSFIRNVDTKAIVPVIDNTFVFYPESVMKAAFKGMLSCGSDCVTFLNSLMKGIPKDFFNKSDKQKYDYVDKNFFRISITSFIDKYNFEAKSVKKECVHIITPDLKRIPFSVYNMIHRGK
jgi:uncharacterized radical SAM superfamily Fe-S cluster-containing enzyme